MKVAVFIDGSNFYRKLKNLHVQHTSKFHYADFINNLCGNHQISYIGYYVGLVKKEKNNPKSQVLYSNQQKLFSFLQLTIPNIRIVKGHIQHFNGTYQEKGVDVRLALDVFRLAADSQYDCGILVSSDSDLIPAIKFAQNKYNKKILYIGFKHNPSYALLRESRQNKLLEHADVEPFTYANSTSKKIHQIIP